MPRVEFDLDDKGEVIGTVPPELESFLKRTHDRGHVAGYGAGREETAKEARKQIELAIAAEKTRLEKELPFERDKWAGVDEENKQLRRQMMERDRDHERLLREREEKHAKDMLDRSESLKRRETRIQELVKSTLRGEALRAGARDESLEELEEFLFSRIGFDDDLQPFPKQADGSPKTVNGKPLPIDVFVKQYLDAHPHHRKATGGAGGGARRGASFSGTDPGGTSVEAARERIANGDRSPAAINELFQATRAKAASA